MNTDDSPAMNKKPEVVHSDHESNQKDKNNISSGCKLWEEIVSRNMALHEFVSSLQKEKHLTVQHVELDFLNEKVFPLLLQCLIEVLQKAKELDSLYAQRMTFNGIDYLAELLYNCNPRHPLRTKKRLLQIPFVKKWLKENPKTNYGKGVGCSEEIAATVIQAWIRGFLVRNRNDVQEMRTFWKVIENQKKTTDEVNGTLPDLSKSR